MWLLNAETECLEHVPGERSESGPDGKQYAILSHRWLSDNNQEVFYSDLRSNTASSTARKTGLRKIWPLRRHDVPAYKQKQGYRKASLCCQQALRQQLNYVWIDTCCINKADESETAEAIRSMYSWYRRASICYVYLADVTAERLTSIGGQPGRAVGQSDWRLQFEASSWFRRGWTLQELLAPRMASFYNADWKYLGTLEDLAIPIAGITRIGQSCLTRYMSKSGLSLSDYSYAQRLSWAANRKTSRGEDRTYSLLGIFNVHLPVLYSEGTKSAFRRLQEELFKRSADQSLLLWTGPSGGLLSPSIDYFQGCDMITSIGNSNRSSDYVLDDKRYRTYVPIIRLENVAHHSATDVRENVGATHVALLNCRYVKDPTNGPALCLKQLSQPDRNGDLRFCVVGGLRRVQRLPLAWFIPVKPQHINIVRGSEKRSKGMRLRLRSQAYDCSLYVHSWYPSNGWSHEINHSQENDMCYTFWPRTPGAGRAASHTAAVIIGVTASSETFHIAVAMDFDERADHTRILHLAHRTETSLEELCRTLDGPAPSPAPPPHLDMGVSRTCRLLVSSGHGRIKIALLER